MAEAGTTARVLARLDPKLAGLHAANFLGLGVYLPFFPLWLQSRGLSPSEIGQILGISIAVRVVATAPLMSLIDRGIGPRTLLSVGTLSLVALYALLPWQGGAVGIGLLIAVGAVAQAPIIPATDLVTTNAVRQDPRLDYGRIRLWGSVAFLVMNILAGYVVGWLGPASVMWLLQACALVCFLLIRFSWPARATEERAEAVAEGPILQAKLPKALLRLILAGACVQASHAAVYGFGTLQWRAQGFADEAIGFLWAAGIVAEIALFGWLGRFVGRRGAAAWLIGFGAIVAILRFAAMAAAPGLAGSFALQALHGLSFGATHLGTMAALTSLAPPGGRGKAQGLTSAVSALAMAASTALSGYVFGRAGAWAFAAMAPLAAVGLVLAIAAARLDRPQPQREGEGG